MSRPTAPTNTVEMYAYIAISLTTFTNFAETYSPKTLLTVENATQPSTVAESASSLTKPSL
ncbi:MAG: hypothetical protein QW514_00955 [Thermoprotei archaeon]